MVVALPSMLPRGGVNSRTIVMNMKSHRLNCEAMFSRSWSLKGTNRVAFNLASELVGEKPRTQAIQFNPSPDARPSITMVMASRLLISGGEVRRQCAAAPV